MIKATPFIFITLWCSVAFAAESDINWVTKSNGYSQPVLELRAKYDPEGAGRRGVDGYDEAILDLRPNVYERRREDTRTAVSELEKLLRSEPHPKVRQDLQILIQVLNDRLTSDELNRRLMLPYFDVSATAFLGIRSLLNANVDKSRHAAAVVRLTKYAGLSTGDEPITELAKARIRERFDVAGLVGPYRRQVRRDLANSEQYLKGISDLMHSHGMEGWEIAHQKMVEQKLARIIRRPVFMDVL